MSTHPRASQHAVRVALGGAIIATVAASIWVLSTEPSSATARTSRSLERLSARISVWASAAAFVGAVGGLAFAARRRTTPDSSGSARWASTRDIADMLAPRNAPAPRNGLTLGFVRGRRLTLDRAKMCTHVLILGPTGAGKSRGFLMPNLDHPRADSFVATDPKGELFACTAGFQKRARRYAPLEPDASEPFNWIPRCRDVSIAKLLGRALAMQRQTSEGKASDFFWLEGESLILGALFAHVAETDDPTPTAALRMVTSLGTEQFVDALTNSPSHVARDLVAGLRHGDDKKLRSGMMIGVTNALMILADDRVAQFTSSTHRGADFTELRSWPVGVYWVLPPQDVAPLTGLTAIFLNLLLYDIKHAEGDTGVTMFIDEVGNVGRLPDLSRDITLVRDLDISFVLCTQSASQFVTLYGSDQARTIMDNCLTTCVLRGLRPETAEQVSRALGERTVYASSDGRSSSTSGGWFGRVSRSQSENWSERGRRLLTADEVRCIPDEKAIVIHNNRPPVLVDRHHSTLTRRFTR